MLSRCRQAIDDVIGGHRGRIFGTAGDNVIAEFPSAVEALRCAIQIQQRVQDCNRDLPERSRMQFRIGVNLGDVIVTGSDLLGDGVNVAARLEKLAEPGSICISRSVFDQVEGKLDCHFVDLGAREVKNIARPVHDLEPLRRRSLRRGLRRARHPDPVGQLDHEVDSDIWQV